MNGEVVILDTDFLYAENDPNIFWQGVSKEFEYRYQLEKEMEENEKAHFNQSTVLNSLVKKTEEEIRTGEMSEQKQELEEFIKSRTTDIKREDKFEIEDHDKKSYREE